MVRYRGIISVMTEEMSETTMPAAEATSVDTSFDERNSYEFAFHILPTVAEGEVPGVLEKIKAHITHAEGELFDEELPERLDLVYPIVKQIEGKNRKFTSAYFGWVRFKLESNKLEALKEELDGEQAILRDLMLKLTKVEEANPFRYHEHNKSVKMVEVIDEVAEVIKEAPVELEESAVVSDEALDESLVKITGEEEKTA